MKCFKAIFRLNITIVTISLIVLCLQGCRLTGAESTTTQEEKPFRGFFKISSPSGVSALNLDSTYDVLWSSPDSLIKDQVRISLYQGDKFIANLSSGLLNIGSFSWNLSYTRAISQGKFGSGIGYRLKFSSESDTSKWDFSRTFQVYTKYSGTLSVSSPILNTIVYFDSALTVKWTSTGDIGSTVGLLLFKDTVLVSDLGSASAISGWYSIPKLPLTFGSSPNYRIRVFSTSDPSIASLSPPFRISSGYSGKFVFSSPIAGDSIVSGNPTEIAWKISGNPGTYVSIDLYRDSILVKRIGSFVKASGGIYTWDVPPGMVEASNYRIKMTSQSDIGLFSFSSSFTIQGIRPDTFENDDSLWLAKPISVDGKKQEHTLSESDNDYLSFNSIKGKYYLADIRSLDSNIIYRQRFYGVFLDSAGRYTPDSSQRGPSTLILLGPTYAGKHYLKVSSGLDLGSYTVAITEYDSTKNIFDIGVGFTSPNVNSTWEIDSSYSISWATNNPFYESNINLDLYLDTTRVQTIYSPKYKWGNYTWQIPSQLATSDKYRLKISSNSNTRVFSYSPFFAIKGLPDDTFELDNSKATAKLLAADGAVQSRSIRAGEVDWIRIEAKTGKRYVFSVHALESIDGYLLDSSGHDVRADNYRPTSYYSGTNFRIDFSPTYTGSYYLQMGSWSPYSSYTISLIEFDSTQNGFTPKFIAPDTNTSWAAGSVHAISWTPVLADYSYFFGADGRLLLYLDTDYVEEISSVRNSTGSYSWDVPTGLAASNKYRIQLQNPQDRQTYVNSAPFTISGLTPDIYEPDNSQNLAKEITTDGVAQTHNLTRFDSDWITFAAFDSQTYVVSLNSSNSQQLSFEDEGRLVDGSGFKITQVINPTKSKKYYLNVRSNDPNGAYTLSVMAYDWGLPVTFTTPNSTSSWLAGTSYYLHWMPDSALFGSHVDLDLYQGTRNVGSLYSYCENRGKVVVTLPINIVPGNNYRIRISSFQSREIFGYSQPFSVTGLPDDVLEPNNTVETAKAVIPNSVRQALTLTTGDRDWFKFTGKANMYYKIQATSLIPLTTSLKLYSTTGSVLLQTGVGAVGDSTVNSIQWICPADGIYNLSVEGETPSQNGAYRFEIMEMDLARYKFTVIGPAIGTYAKKGQSLLVLWSDPASYGGTVDILLYNSTGLVQALGSNLVNSGMSLLLTPSSVPTGNDYWIKIVSRKNSAVNGASSNFVIEP